MAGASKGLSAAPMEAHGGYNPAILSYEGTFPADAAPAAGGRIRRVWRISP